MSRPDPGELLGLAVAAAGAAAAMLAAGRPAGPKGRPAVAILGEEGGATGEAGASQVRWIVDPLDGTVNYLYGLADWSVSIAAELDGTVVAGVVTAPALGEVFTATLGGGAWLHAGDGPPVALRCNTGVPLDQALVSTG